MKGDIIFPEKQDYVLIVALEEKVAGWLVSTDLYLSSSSPCKLHNLFFKACSGQSQKQPTANSRESGFSVVDAPL